jgi:glutamyl-tRNA synthetase
VSREDIASGPKKLRLKDLCNLELSGEKARFIGNDLSILKEGVPIVHWVPRNSLDAELLMPDGTTRKGFAEPSIRNAEGKIVQLERVAFAKVEAVSPLVRLVLTHR